MTPENFCYWLRGYFEIHGNNTKNLQEYGNIELCPDQIKMINKNLIKVFNELNLKNNTPFIVDPEFFRDIK